MKGKFIWVALAATAVLLTGCSRDKDGLIPGSYTYKISGSLTLLPSWIADLEEDQLDLLRTKGIVMDPVTCDLSTEQGQMQILEDGDSLIVTFNNILGNADVTSATLKNGVLTLSGKDTKSVQLTDGALKKWNGRVLYGGSGKRYDDTLILDLKYTGQFTIALVDMTIVSSEVKCVATSNR